MNILADNAPVITAKRNWTAKQETLLVGLLFCWFMTNGTLYRVKAGPDRVVAHFERLFHELQLKYLQQNEVRFRTGKAIKKRFEVIKQRNKRGNRQVLYSLVNKFFNTYRGYDLFTTTLLSAEQVGLTKEYISTILRSTPALDFNSLNVPVYCRQQRVNSWYPAENALLLRAISKFFLRYGSFTPPRKKEEDTRKTWEQVNEIFESVKRYQPDIRFPKRSGNALCRHYKSLKANQAENMSSFYLYGLKIFNREI